MPRPKALRSPSREAFFENADVLSLHLPGNRDTRGIITADDLARMKPTALLVNTSRAPIIAPGVFMTSSRRIATSFATPCIRKRETSERS